MHHFLTPYGLSYIFTIKSVYSSQALPQHHLKYQANSVKNSPVLSYQFIGLRAFKDRRLRIRNQEWQAAYQQIQNLMRQPLNV